MRKEDFDFNLPEKLIAQHPLANRSDSRLLVYGNDGCEHNSFDDFINYVNPGDLVVLNNSKVIAARLYGKKTTGGKVEILVERIIDSHNVKCHIRASKAPKKGTTISLDKGFELLVVGREDDLFIAHANVPIVAILSTVGHMPLPPYITREDTNVDTTRYQTVYARHDGSVAAPTAGLHIDTCLLNRLQEKGVQIAYVTLHVGAGTFKPVREFDIKKHKMHAERIDVSQRVCDLVEQTKANKKRIIAIGTTSVRALESAVDRGKIAPYCGETDIFIYPGYEFKVVDAMVTNFHLPQSTLLMLVAAFIGRTEMMDLYQEAINNNYRFFSYGDATLLMNAHS
jgi:S-adenosylmethionine:tRNA ribosyltransferase-isomerase